MEITGAPGGRGSDDWCSSRIGAKDELGSMFWLAAHARLVKMYSTLSSNKR